MRQDHPNRQNVQNVQKCTLENVHAEFHWVFEPHPQPVWLGGSPTPEWREYNKDGVLAGVTGEPECAPPWE
jgi:hypothetical protein